MAKKYLTPKDVIGKMVKVSADKEVLVVEATVRKYRHFSEGSWKEKAELHVKEDGGPWYLLQTEVTK